MSPLRLRRRLFERPFYRLVFSESDDLPGLVVDRYDDVLVAQIGTAGMELRRDLLAELLLALPGVRTLVLRNDAPARALEGLPDYVETLGEPAPAMLRVEENGARFELPLTEGQKTGRFYDHLCVDSSAPALALVEANAALNGVAGRVGVRQGDAFDTLKALRADGRRFDVVVLDPPAFIRRRKDMQAGQEAYRRVNRLAAQLVEDEGLLLSASCSSHLRRERLLELMVSAAGPVGRELRVLVQGHQGADHPVHPGLPESDYLKSWLCRVSA